MLTIPGSPEVLVQEISPGERSTKLDHARLSGQPQQIHGRHDMLNECAKRRHMAHCKFHKCKTHPTCSTRAGQLQPGCGNNCTSIGVDLHRTNTQVHSGFAYRASTGWHPYRLC